VIFLIDFGRPHIFDSVVLTKASFGLLGSHIFAFIAGGRAVLVGEGDGDGDGDDGDGDGDDGDGDDGDGDDGDGDDGDGDDGDGDDGAEGVWA
jgi:hypothetical protein